MDSLKPEIQIFRRSRSRVMATEVEACWNSFNTLFRPKLFMWFYRIFFDETKQQKLGTLKKKKFFLGNIMNKNFKSFIFNFFFPSLQKLWSKLECPEWSCLTVVLIQINSKIICKKLNLRCVLQIYWDLGLLGLFFFLYRRDVIHNLHLISVV